MSQSPHSNITEASRGESPIRPYNELPTGAWVMAQQWSKLLFAHWPVPAEILRPLIPSGLQLDTFEGQAWIGIVPFQMSGVRARYLPPIPFTSNFPELNVRTYVTADKPGVWFFSLDAGNPLAVTAARTAFHLPYFNAEMSINVRGEAVAYRSRRTHRGAPPAEFQATYRPTSDVFHAEPGSLEYFLTERLCLYSMYKTGSLYRGDITHARWPLQRAEAQISVNTMAASHGIQLPDVSPTLHYVEFLAMRAWYLKRITL